jgi:hypothetical protein
MSWFVDTNVLIYAIDERFPDKKEKADLWLRELGRREAIVLSAQSLNNFIMSRPGDLGGREMIRPVIASGRFQDGVRLRSMSRGFNLLGESRTKPVITTMIASCSPPLCAAGAVSFFRRICSTGVASAG